MKEFMNLWMNSWGLGLIAETKQLLLCLAGLACSLSTHPTYELVYTWWYNFENFGKFWTVSEAASHIKVQTFPMNISWGSIPCLTQRVCPTWVAGGSDGLPPDVLISLLNSPWRCSQSSILPWAPCRDGMEERNEEWFVEVQFISFYAGQMLIPN